MCRNGMKGLWLHKDSIQFLHTQHARAAGRPRRQAGGAHCAVLPALVLDAGGSVVLGIRG